MIFERFTIKEVCETKVQTSGNGLIQEVFREEFVQALSIIESALKEGIIQIILLP